MHPEAWNFLKRVVPVYNEDKPVVLEMGSYNVNGSVRELFSQAMIYEGIDVRPGPGVDMVMNAHDIVARDVYDIVVTTETLEHDSRPQHLIQVAWDALVEGGHLILTAASTGRPLHSVNGDQQFQPGEHYNNIDQKDMREWLVDWQNVEIEYNPSPGDIYVVAQKPYALHA